MFTDYVRRQADLRLTECSIFAANHSAAIQESTYLSAEVKRAKALIALKSYQAAVGAGQKELTGAAGKELTGGAADTEGYEQRVVEDLLTMNEQHWTEACERERIRAENEMVKREKFVTSNVRFNALSLIIGLGQSPEFTEACGVDVLQYFLGAGAKCLNLKGKSLILTMLDYAPKREDSLVLLRNLYRLCNLSSSPETTVEGLEDRWTHQVVRSLYNLTTEAVKNLANRELLCLLSLNEAAGFKYCFGNPTVKFFLTKLCKDRREREKSIRAYGSSGKRPTSESDSPEAKKVKKCSIKLKRCAIPK